MAVVYPAASDNWSTVANWMSGGAPYGQLPQSGDIVCANGKTVTIDMDLAAYTFDRLTTAATAPAAAGGAFTMGISATINANITAGTTTCLTSTGTGTTLVINGDIKGGGSNNAYGIYCLAACTVTITGNVTGGSGNSAFGIYYSAACTVTITGNVTAGSGNSAYGIYCLAACTVTITGNVTAGSGTYAYGILCNAACTVTITGNVTGGGGGAAYGMYCTAACTITVTGNVTGGGTYGIYCITQTSYVTIRGIITTQTPPIAQYQAIYGTIVLYFAGIIISKTGMLPFSVQQFFLLSSGSTMWTVKTELNTDKNIYTADYAPLGNPAITDVRNATVFGPVGELTGTLKVPPPAAVAFAVPTDNTTGTMQITPPDIQAACESALTAYGAAKTTDLSSIDIQTGLTAYGAAKTSDLAGIDIGAGLTAYGAAKTTDIINELKTSPEDVAERIRNLATVEAVGDIHAT
jgi:hypothetical protein